VTMNQMEGHCRALLMDQISSSHKSPWAAQPLRSAAHTTQKPTATCQPGRCEECAGEEALDESLTRLFSNRKRGTSIRFV